MSAFPSSRGRVANAAAANVSYSGSSLRNVWNLAQLSHDERKRVRIGGVSIGGCTAQTGPSRRNCRIPIVIAALNSNGSVGGKVRRVYVCDECNARFSQYYGRCPKCSNYLTMPQEGVIEAPPATAVTVYPGSGRVAGADNGIVYGGGAGVQAFERIRLSSGLFPRRDGTASNNAIGTTSSSVSGGIRGRDGGPEADDDRSGGDGSGGNRAVGWFGDDGGRADVPLSLRALSQLGASGSRATRIPLSGRTGAEVQRVLGGGVVPGALVLLGGDPGVGKSTLTLQIAAMMAHPELDYDAVSNIRQVEDEGEGVEKVRGGGGDVPYSESSTESVLEGEEWQEEEMPDGIWYDDRPYEDECGSEVRQGRVEDVLRSPHRTVLYVTAEETREQVVARSRRMGLSGCEGVVVASCSEMGAIARTILQVRPDAVVLDSINTVYLGSLPQAPGTVTQVRECGQLLLRIAKEGGVTVFIVGHVTKSGDLAGPNTLAHMVDTVLYLEGDVAQSVRLLRVIKNRHGSDAECGVFSMDASGLHAVANHSALFLESRLADSGTAGEQAGSGSVVGITLQGTRAILLEVQALVSPLADRSHTAASSSTGLSYRTATGVDKQRLANLCAILQKHVTTLELSACSVIVNVVGGAQVRDVATDLALAVAIAASYFNVVPPRDLAVCGEVDLAGRVRRSFQRLDVRLREAAKLGFRRVIIPQTKDWQELAADPQLAAAGVMMTAVRNVSEALTAALGPGVADHRPAHIPPPRRGIPGAPSTARFTKRRGSPTTRPEPAVEVESYDEVEGDPPYGEPYTGLESFGHGSGFGAEDDDTIASAAATEVVALPLIDRPMGFRAGRPTRLPLSSLSSLSSTAASAGPSAPLSYTASSTAVSFPPPVPPPSVLRWEGHGSERQAVHAYSDGLVMAPYDTDVPIYHDVIRGSGEYSEGQVMSNAGYIQPLGLDQDAAAEVAAAVKGDGADDASQYGGGERRDAADSRPQDDERERLSLLERRMRVQRRRRRP